MSDFGAIVYVRKKDSSLMLDVDFQAVVKAAAALQSTTSLSNALAEPYLFNIGKTIQAVDSKCYCVNVLLSDCWGNADDFEWSRSVEEQDSQAISKELSVLLGSAYTLEPKFEWW